MKSPNWLCRVPTVLFLVAVFCQASFGQNDTPVVVKHGADSAADILPSLDSMLATALKHNSEVRAARVELDRIRLQVAKEIRVFREEWRAARAVLAKVTPLQREFDRLKEVGPGAISGKRLLEAEPALDAARARATDAAEKMKELRSLLPHLLGHEAAALSIAHHAHNRKGGPPVAKLLDERLALLGEIVELYQAAYKSSEVSFDAVASAQRDLLQARLELANSANERVKIRREMVQVSQYIEKVTKQLFQAKQTSKPDMLKATASRLRAEADLKREQLANELQH